MRLATALCAVVICLTYLATPTAAGLITLDNPLVPAGLGIGDRFHLAFVTEGARNATSSSIADYNDFVQTEAERSAELSALGTSWFAIGSTNTVDARDNALVSAPVYRVDGARIADGFSDIWDGSIANSLSIDQFGDTKSATLRIVWTGTATDGTALSPPLGGSGNRFEFGFYERTDAGWISAFTFDPDTTTNLPFYALSEPLQVSPATPIPEPSSLVLLTLGSGLCAAVAFRRRRQRNQPPGASHTQ